MRARILICPYMEGVMVDLAEHGRVDGVGHGADQDRAVQVGGGQGVERGEEGGPARVPAGHDLGPGGGGGFGRDELGVAVAVGLLAVRGEEVSEAAAQVAGDVVGDDGHRVEAGGEDAEEAFVVELGEGVLGEGSLAVEHLSARCDEIGWRGCRETAIHARLYR
jgi:hypothetical protein